MASDINALQQLNQTEIGWILGVNTKWLRDHPEVPRNPDGKTYNARDVVAWKVASLLPQEVSGEESKDEAERRLKIAQANEREVIVEIKRRELVSADLVTQYLPHLASQLRSGGERIEKHHNSAALELYNEIIGDACDSIEAFINDLCEQGTEETLARPDDSGSEELPKAGAKASSKGTT